MNKHHKYLLNQIKTLSKEKPYKTKLSNNYAGHNDPSYALSNPQIRKIVKSWIKENKNITFTDYENLLDSIYTQSKSSTEKYMGGYLLEYFPKLRNQINPNLLITWLENLTGWAQIDSLCQNKFSAEDLLKNWKAWEKLLKKFNKSKNISKRRASLVLLTGVTRKSTDKKFTDLAIQNIENLKHEKDILITKAISWLLREMVALHSDLVSEYLERNLDSLPNIAIRETRNKLRTGKK